MSFGDFVVHYEHKFLRNIYTNEQIKDSYNLKDLDSYEEIFEEFNAICIGLLVFLNNFNKNDFINKFYGDEIIGIKNTIAKTEINALSSTYGKVPKCNLKIYTYV